MKKTVLRLGVMGGTFDPIHTAHLVMAEEARIAHKLDRVLFIPAGQPPHKMGYRVTDQEHRYSMVLLGTAANAYFDISRMELERIGPSYSVDTIRELKKIYGESTEIFFIVGADEALDLAKWHEAESLPKLARFLVAPRPGFGLAELEKTLPPEFISAIDVLPIAPMEISSTDLRTRVSTGQSIKYLVPDSVEEYISKYRLYLESNDL
jgi:nicotinate-nucleotide adenylyltransferase